MLGLARDGSRLLAAMIAYVDRCDAAKTPRPLAWRMCSKTMLALQCHESSTIGREESPLRYHGVDCAPRDQVLAMVCHIPVEINERAWYGSVTAICAVTELNGAREAVALRHDVARVGPGPQAAAVTSEP